MSIIAGEDILANSFITSSLGTASVGKGIRLNSIGKFEHSLIYAPNYIPMTAGEALTGATTPQAVYVHTDGKVYVCDGDDATKYNFIGFVKETANADATVRVITDGIVDGFTGLTIGSNYYVQNDKTIGTAFGTYIIRVGVAISATQIMIKPNTNLNRYEITATEKTVASDSTWLDIDVSANVPVFAKYVDVLIFCTVGNDVLGGVRINGSSENSSFMKITDNSADPVGPVITVGLDSNRIFEGYTGNRADTRFVVFAYWG